MNSELFRRYMLISVANELYPKYEKFNPYYEDLYLDNLVAIELMELGC